MKSFIKCSILCGLVLLAGCSGDSSKQPSVDPVPNDTWQITALDVSNPNPFVGAGVWFVATVTVNGSAAPDGTSVEFSTAANDGVAGFENGEYTANVLTSGGEASVVFGSVEAGPFIVQARVKTATRTKQVVYKDPDNTGELQIYNINPTAGSYYGGETVVLTGKGITAPAEVYFTVQGVEYQAIVDGVVPSSPASSGNGTITIRTPEPTAADDTLTSQADVKAVVGVGTGNEQQQIGTAAFTYVANTEPPPDVPPVPVIFGVDPYYGRSQGGEAVTVLGLDFSWDDGNKTVVPTFDEVFFVFQGQELRAEVDRWSATQIDVITPRFSLIPLTDDVNAGIKLTRIGYDSVVKNDVFIVQSDVATPEITGLSPTAGPLDGGTIVTINGHGFQLPIQVHFGDLEATDIQLYDDQSLVDNDIITCTTPDYSQQGQVPPIFVNVVVTNLQSGLSDTSDQTFRYGDSLYVGQANPTEGQIGDQFALYGAGFEDPLTVWFSSGNIEFDVLLVTGTELTLRSPTDLAPTCVDRSGSFRVVLNESNREATGGSYTLLGSNPTITSVEPIFVQETQSGNGVTPSEIDIYGVRFAEELLVLIDNYTIEPSFVTVESSEHIYVSEIPAPNEFGLVFNTTSCTTQNGLQGIRDVPTPVDVTVRNLPLGCQDTLEQTLVYIPEDESCQVAPDMQVIYTNPFPGTTPAGGSSPAEPLTINNNGAGTLDIQTLLLQGQFFFDGGCSIQDEGPISIPPFGSDTSLNLYFCPDLPNGETYNGQLVITSNNPGSPNNYPLSGVELTPAVIGTQPYGNGDSWGFGDQTAGGCGTAQVLTISNGGVSEVIFSTTLTGGTNFVINNPATDVSLLQGQSYPLSVQFCPTATGATSDTLQITHNAANVTSPIQITLEGNGT